MRKPYVTLVTRKVTDSDGKNRVTAIGIEFGLRDEDYAYTVEEAETPVESQ